VSLRWSLLSLLLLLGAPPRARAESSSTAWVREHLTVEWVFATAGWRTALGSDPQASGFHLLGGGMQLALGLQLSGPLGLLAEGRFVLGRAGTPSELAYEGTGALLAELRLGDAVRLRLGPQAGLLRLESGEGTLVGGLLEGSFGLAEVGRRVSLVLVTRLEIDALLGPRTLPVRTLGVSVGLGIRY
jgi:hypothetical protein